MKFVSLKKIINQKFPKGIKIKVVGVWHKCDSTRTNVINDLMLKQQYIVQCRWGLPIMDLCVFNQIFSRILGKQFILSIIWYLYKKYWNTDVQGFIRLIFVFTDFSFRSKECYITSCGIIFYICCYLWWKEAIHSSVYNKEEILYYCNNSSVNSGKHLGLPHTDKKTFCIYVWQLFGTKTFLCC